MAKVSATVDGVMGGEASCPGQLERLTPRQVGRYQFCDRNRHLMHDLGISHAASHGMVR